MKKLTAILIAAVMLICTVPFSASAAIALPFELSAPQHLSAQLADTDSPTTASIAFSLTDEICDFFTEKQTASETDALDAFYAKYNITDVSITSQLDWAVDDASDPVSGWHYNEYWDGEYGYLGVDEEYSPRYGVWDGVDIGIGDPTSTAQGFWVTRGVTHDDFYGYGDPIPALKDQLKPSQYTYDDETGLTIDYTAHTMYYRARLVVMIWDLEGEVRFSFSDWSNTAAVGKDAEAYEPITELPAPVIADLRMTDEEFNGYPVVAFTLTVPEEVSALAAKAASAGGGLRIQTFARVKGDAEWTEMGNTDYTVSSGERKCALITLASNERAVSADSAIELRCRYYCSQSGLDDVYSDYSKTVSFTGAEIPKIDTSTVFDDVAAGKWYKEALDYAYNTGLMNGVSDKKFAPNDPTSRAMLVTVLWRAEGSPAIADAVPFTDLKQNWYKQAVAWAYKNGIVNGMTDTTFAPSSPITREQIAAIMFRYCKYKGDDVSARADISSFPDYSKAHSYAIDSLSWANAAGLINGTKNGSVTLLDPRGKATRAQVATILMRYLES